MFAGFFDLFRGIYTSPILVALARGVLEAAAFAAILSATEYVSGGNLPDEMQPFGSLILLGLRVLEGMADRIDPAKQRTV